MANKSLAAGTSVPSAGDANSLHSVTDAMLMAIDIEAYLLQVIADLEQGEYTAAKRMMAQAVQKLAAFVDYLRHFEQQQQQAQP
jgi:hypothetical protein